MFVTGLIFFLLRQHQKARMKSLRDKIKASIHYREYASIEAFMDHIMGDLYEALDEDFTSIGVKKFLSNIYNTLWNLLFYIILVLDEP
jgi:hypothetical protein